ncbi:MAG: hypothetical protein ACFFC6_12905 [Promethearchaeota archaeon]
MPTIAYFISDHGFGHAARSIAIIRSLLDCDLEISIEIHTSKPLSYIQRSFSQNEEEQRVTYHEQINDFGFIGDKRTGGIDYQKTAIEVSSWIENWHISYLFDLYHNFKSKNTDLFVSDIAPQPFLLAKKLDLPSIAISNFTWLDIYQNPAFDLGDLDTLWKAYREASLGLLLPFNLENTVFCSAMETHLVSRHPTRSKQQMRELLGLGSDEQVIYLATGFSLKNPFLQEWADKTDSQYILGGQHQITHPKIKTVPRSDPEGQDYINCSNVAVIKLGYSSVSEAIRSHVPILGIDFPQTVETKRMKKGIEELGIGLCITSEEFFQGKWLEKISEVIELKQNYSHLPDRFVKHGESQIAGIILDLLDEIC